MRPSDDPQPNEIPATSRRLTFWVLAIAAGVGFGCQPASRTGSPPRESGASQSTEEELILTVRVLDYDGDVLHSTAVAEGRFVHPQAFDSALCEIIEPKARAGEKLQIWGWNQEGGPLDARLREPGNSLRIRCRSNQLEAPPWGSGPSGWGQWNVEVEDS